jgi:ATP-dependent DNA ligase
MERSKGEAILGNTIAPMLALKVYFRDAMAELCRGHRAHSKQIGLNLLPLRNPAILCEVKLDGERMVVHVRRGIVTMQTRRGRWYSDLYSAVLAPSIRRAIAKWDVDVIFDGEVIAWDNGKQETIPFGNNRTIALARQRWMESQGLVDSRDRNLHEGQRDLNVMKPAYVDGDVVESIAGSDCWLRYEVFDILYVGGPQAADLISRAALLSSDEVKIGSIIHLNGFQRKRILHQLVTPQEKEVVLVPALVVRPNGVAVLAEDYFSAASPTKEMGYQASIVDSIEWGLDASVEEKEVYDHMRGRLSDTELGIRRAESADRFYSDIVDVRGLEGVLLKDLNASYLLEGRKYWCKHKPDYEENSELGDIDLIILGAYHGTGMGPSGKLNGFLCGCVDEDNPDTYIAVVKVNGGGVSRDISDQMLTSTGYKKQTDTEPWDTGQWFRGDYHGKSVPDFISRRSFQQSEGRPPVFEKRKYPDLWIHPDDSIVLTLKAGEIVATDGFQAGITLRFPRIERVRMKDSADDKDARHVETLEGLHRAYREQMQRREGSGEIEFQSGSVTSGKATRRFQTAEMGLRKKPVRRNVNDRGPEWTMPTADRKESSALNGLAIVALEGIYELDEGSLDAEEAKQQGWFDFAKSIRDRDDLLLFISKHGGIPKISVSQDTDFVIGGRADDSRVVMHQHGLENAIKERRKRRTGLTSEHMIKIGSVLKWTYLVAMVHLWKQDIKSFKGEDGQDTASLLRSSCIKSTHPHLLEPSRHQYLATVQRSSKGDDVFGISTTEMCTLIDFKRGLQEVADEVLREGTKKAKQCPDQRTGVPWQYFTKITSDPETSRCLGGPHSNFLPFNGDDTQTSAIVIYPDVFNSDFGVRDSRIDLDEVKSGEVQNRWKLVAADSGPVASCLPLARAMGAQVTPHLHDGVTHVLCELAKDRVLWNECDGNWFAHVERGREICARLGAMHKGQSKVVFVSPDWVRRHWQRN